jgi:hypothetical protein
VQLLPALQIPDVHVGRPSGNVLGHCDREALD